MAAKRTVSTRVKAATLAPRVGSRAARIAQTAKKKPTITKPPHAPTLPEYKPIRGSLLNAPKPDAVPSLFAEVSDLKKRRYLEALALTPSKGKAARLAGVEVRTAYNWRHDLSDEVFQAGLKVALELGLYRAVDEGWERAIDGWEEPVYQGGRLVGTKLVKDTTMLIFMIKGNLPQYRDRVEHSGPNGGPVPLQAVPYDLSTLSRDELLQLRTIMNRALPADANGPSLP